MVQTGLRESAISINMRQPAILMAILWPLLLAAEEGSRVRYAGGTQADIPAHSDAKIEIQSPEALTLKTGKRTVAISYRDINGLEYGMRVSRRYLEAVLISPMFLLSKHKEHYLTISYLGADGKQQALVLQVNSKDIRPLLVGLEARTGHKVEYQDDEARKAGKG